MLFSYLGSPFGYTSIVVAGHNNETHGLARQSSVNSLLPGPYNPHRL
jgi:hypothetical protein